MKNEHFQVQSSAFNLAYSLSIERFKSYEKYENGSTITNEYHTVVDSRILILKLIDNSRGFHPIIHFGLTKSKIESDFSNEYFC